jgi:hypothetical protein
LARSGFQAGASGACGPARLLEPVRDPLGRLRRNDPGHAEVEPLQARFGGQVAHQRLLADEDEVVALGRLSRDLDPLGPRRRERVRVARAEHQPEAQHGQSLLEPAEVVVPPRYVRCQARVETWNRSTIPE